MRAAIPQLMRLLTSLFSLSLLGSAAFADDTAVAPAAPDRALSPIARAGIPDACTPAARFANSYIQPLAIRSRMALADCLVGPALEPIKSLLDTQDSMLALETAVAPSMKLYDEVIALGNPSQQVLATFAKAKLYEDLLGRMANTVPPAGAGESAAALYQSRKQLLDVILQPWREQALAAFEQVTRLAKAGKREKNPAVRNAIAQSEAKRRQFVATAHQPAPAPHAPVEPAPTEAKPTEAAPVDGETKKPPAADPATP